MAGESPSRGLWAATFVLVAAALFTFEISAAPGHRFPWAAIPAAAVPVALAVLAARFLPPPDGRRPPPSWAVVGLFGLAAAPFVTEPVVEALAGTGRPLEIRMLTGFGYVSLGLAALGRFAKCLRLAAVGSLFLTLFGLSLGNKPAALWCFAAYAGAGVVWLTTAYRAGLRPGASGPPGVVVSAAGPVPAGGRVPWAPAGVAAVLAGLVAGGFALGPGTAFAALWELVPTSGGTGEYDPRARGGVNDGDEETAGANPAATGMVDTDQLLESPLPSLYDAFSDTYGKPHKPREQERAQAISTAAKEQHGKTADSLRPSRTFPTSRQAPPNPRTPLGRAARGLFEIEGPTPLHVRAAVFDSFDGRVWVEAPAACPTPARREGKTNWMACPAPAAPDVFADEPVCHGVKVAKLGRGDTAGAGGARATLDGTLIPAAPHLVRFKLGMIDQETFFSCGADGILRMALRKLPGGVALETEARVQDPRKLAAYPYFAGTAEDPPPTPQGDRVAALAREWAGHLPRGWDQVRAVADRLRAGYELADAGGVPPDHPDVAAFFLFESRRGPDYLFATSAAVLLRHLGYRTRLVAGFYAAPEMYDPETKHTPVGKEHVHVWPEVLVGGDTWVVVEPTPGYEVLTPPKPWYERAVAGLVAAGRWAADRPVPSGLVALAVLAAVWWRRTWVDGLAVFGWRLRAGREWRGWVRGATLLVERRARWAGRPRPAGETPARYFSNGVVPADAPDRDALVRLAELTGWASYAPDGLTPAGEQDVWAACDRAVRSWTYRRFQRMRNAEPRLDRT